MPSSNQSDANPCVCVALVVIGCVFVWLLWPSASPPVDDGNQQPPPLSTLQDQHQREQDEDHNPPDTVIVSGQARTSSTPAPGPAEKQCDFADIKINAADDLLSELKGKVHGQPAAVDTIAASIRGHLVNRSPPKALVLSFHGPTGVGKTFVSEIIANSIYINGTKSPFVQKFSLAKSYIDASRIGEYKTDLRDRIVATLKRCSRSLFIIEEFDTDNVIACELSTVIKVFVEHGAEPFDDVNTKKSMFIFISNQGSEAIIKEAVELVESQSYHLFHCLVNGLLSIDRWFYFYGHTEEEDKQEAMDKRIHKLIRQLARDKLGYRLLAETNLISQYVYFLPLRKKHVELCVRDVLFSGNLPRFLLAKDHMQHVFNELEWIPENNPVFSRSGCKKVEEIVNRMLGAEKQGRALQVEL